MTSLNVSSHSVQRVVTNTDNYDSLLENYIEISHHSRGGSTEQDTNYGSLLASYVAMKHSCHGTKDILKVVDTGRECVNDSRGAIFDNVLTRLIGDKEKMQLLKTVFDEVDEKGNGFINGNELLLAFKKLDLLHYTDVQVHEMFDLIVDEKEGMCFDDFIQLESMPAESKLRLLQNPTQKLNANGLAQIRVSTRFRRCVECTFSMEIISIMSLNNFLTCSLFVIAIKRDILWLQNEDGMPR